MRRALLWISCLVLWVPLALAEARYQLDDQQREVHNVGLNLAYVPGHIHSSFSDIHQLPANTWRINSHRSLNLPASADGVWGRFELVNHSANTWLLVVKWPIIDRMQVKLYYPLRDTWGPTLQDGDQVPVNEHATAHRFLLYPLELPPHEPVVVYFQAKAHEALALPMQVLTANALSQQERLHLAVIYLFFGGMLVILLYNACLYLFTRDRCYLSYLFYLCSVIGYELSLTGLGQEYLWGAWPTFSAKAYGLFASLSFLSALLFARHFLTLGYAGRLISLSNNVLMAYWLMISGAVLLSPAIIYYLLPDAMTLITTAWALVVTVHLWRKGNLAAKHFSIAWGFLIVFTLIHLLAVAGHLPLTTFTLGSQMLGIYIEFILLSIALATRINREREQRISAQNQALQASQQLAQEREEKLLAQQQALSVQYEAQELLELRVAERTKDLAQTQAQLEQAIQELAELSIKDSLTQLYNRRHFDNTAPSEVSRARRTGVALSVLMIDVDYFKQVNDHYGHLFGDECLRRIAHVIEFNTQRAGDLSARYGGDEFIVLLPATSLERAVVVAEKIRSQVGALTLEHRKGLFKPTLSIGISTLEPGGGEDIHTLIHYADLALYQAKKLGRNRLYSHQVSALA